VIEIGLIKILLALVRWISSTVLVNVRYKKILTRVDRHENVLSDLTMHVLRLELEVQHLKGSALRPLP